MFTRVTDKRTKAHAKNKHKKISQRDSYRVTYKQVTEFLKGRHCQVFPFCNDGVRSYAGAEQFGIVIVMVIVRPFPDAGRGKHVHAEQGHNYVSRSRPC